MSILHLEARGCMLAQRCFGLDAEETGGQNPGRQKIRILAAEPARISTCVGSLPPAIVPIAKAENAQCLC